MYENIMCKFFDSEYVVICHDMYYIVCLVGNGVFHSQYYLLQQLYNTNIE